MTHMLLALGPPGRTVPYSLGLAREVQTRDESAWLRLPVSLSAASHDQGGRADFRTYVTAQTSSGAAARMKRRSSTGSGVFDFATPLP
ncbi:MAG TPA: hypothetical protein VLJ17_22555 [Xanthobacteraceae bacterium]|nr:hypothetical protein [Xanthobacteraceae bacterium]